MTSFKPECISFDCYGLLTGTWVSEMAKSLHADEISGERMPAFIENFVVNWPDEVLGAWKR